MKLGDDVAYFMEKAASVDDRVLAIVSTAYVPKTNEPAGVVDAAGIGDASTYDESARHRTVRVGNAGVIDGTVEALHGIRDRRPLDVTDRRRVSQSGLIHP